MDSLKEYMLEKEVINEEFLSEDAALIAAVALGIPTAGVLIAYGGAMVLAAAAKGTKALIRVWNKAIDEWRSVKDYKRKDVGFSQYYNKIRVDPLVRKIFNDENVNQREFANELKDVYAAIDAGLFLKENNIVAEEFSKLSKNLQNNSNVKRAIVNAIIKKTGEPPLWPPSPGNKTYQAIKFSIGIREAKAQATAFRLNAMKTVSNMEEE